MYRPRGAGGEEFLSSDATRRTVFRALLFRVDEVGLGGGMSRVYHDRVGVYPFLVYYL